MSFKFNPITGSLDLVGSGGSVPGSGTSFSYQTILAGTTVTIPENQAMIYPNNISILGDLITRGDLIENYDDSQDEWPRSKIEEGETVVINPKRVMFYRNLNVAGNLRILGDLMEI
jgi:hypothetical protein